MPLRLEIKKKLNTRTERVKSVDFHPVEPWVLSALYSGHLLIHNWEEQSTVKSIEVCTTPIRSAKFIARKQWVICGSDDMMMRVFNYNSMEKVKEFDCHIDFVRYIAVHPTLSLVLSASDDMTVKLWDWDQDWARVATFEGHSHYVMMCQWNPKDPHIFATASLDRSIKVWGTQAPGVSTGGVISQPHFNLLGHERGVNCLNYSPNGEKPYIVSGSDDHSIRVWDYQTKQCINVLTGHTGKISSTVFHPYLPIIISGSEDSTVNIWHSTTYRLETTLVYHMGRAWAVNTDHKTNAVVLGLDEGTIVLKLGSERPKASMQGGKVVMAKCCDISTANIKLVDELLCTDGERLPLAVKDLGACEIFPQSLSHHPNGRLIAVCGDGEYVIYTSQALRNKAYGKALDIVWSHDGDYAVRDESGKVIIFHNFKEHYSFKPSFDVEELFGGQLIGVKSSDFICFYDWQEYRLIRRIDVHPETVYWNDAGTYVVLACTEAFYILSHDTEAVAAAIAGGAPETDEGIDIAFDLNKEVNEKVESGIWVSDCFVFTTDRLRLQTIIAGQIDTVAFLDRQSWLLGYLSDTNRLYLIDRDLSIISFKLQLSLVEYQVSICRKDFETATKIYEKIPVALHNKVARFLENQGHKEFALQVTKDLDHKFELALVLGKLQLCAQIIKEAQAVGSSSATISSSRKQLCKFQWQQLGDVALDQGAIALAIACFKEAEDLNGLTLIYSCIGDAEGLRFVAEKAVMSGQANISVLCFLLLQEVDKCLDILINANRIPEAALFARTYAPSQISRVIKLWKEQLASNRNDMIGANLGDPAEHPELFPKFEIAVQAEQLLKKHRDTSGTPLANQHSQLKCLLDIDIINDIEKLGIEQVALVFEERPQAPISNSEKDVEDIEEEQENVADGFDEEDLIIVSGNESETIEVNGVASGSGLEDADDRSSSISSAKTGNSNIDDEEFSELE